MIGMHFGEGAHKDDQDRLPLEGSGRRQDSVETGPSCGMPDRLRDTEIVTPKVADVDAQGLSDRRRREIEDLQIARADRA